MSEEDYVLWIIAQLICFTILCAQPFLYEHTFNRIDREIEERNKLREQGIEPPPRKSLFQRTFLWFMK